MSELVLYSSDDGKTHLHLRVEGETVWLSQLEIAELFQTSKQNVSLHAKNIFADNELARSATVKESLTVQYEGVRKVRRKLTHYNLDLILAIGYRVREQENFSAPSPLATSEPKLTKETRHSREGGNPATTFALGACLRGGDDGFWGVVQRSSVHPSATAALDSRLRGNDVGFCVAVSRFATIARPCNALCLMALTYSGLRAKAPNPATTSALGACLRGKAAPVPSPACGGRVRVGVSVSKKRPNGC